MMIYLYMVSIVTYPGLKSSPQVFFVEDTFFSFDFLPFTELLLVPRFLSLSTVVPWPLHLPIFNLHFWTSKKLLSNVVLYNGDEVTLATQPGQAKHWYYTCIYEKNKVHCAMYVCTHCHPHAIVFGMGTTDCMSTLNEVHKTNSCVSRC